MPWYVQCSPRSGVSVKKEPPSSPSIQSNTRHRPRKLDLSASTHVNSGAPTSRAPLTSREGGMAMQDVGLACLSPGFQTHDPTMREQLQRSISVRDQQRSIIESRLQKSAKGDGPDGIKPSDSNLFGSMKSSSKKRPPPGLSIVPPSASQFANERVVQSAPLNQTFTGRHQPPPITRHLISHPSDLTSSPSSSSHIHHAPANQTNNRLPPISDVFGSDTLGPRDRDRDANTNGYYHAPPASSTSQSHNLGPIPSPGLPTSHSSQQQQQPAKRAREYRSAEEAVHEMSGGREELLPRIVHYNSSVPANQASPSGPHFASNSNNGIPPAPTTVPNSHSHNHSHSHSHSHSQSQANGTAIAPAPAPAHLSPRAHLPHPSSSSSSTTAATGTARRRARNEYERDNGSPPLGNGPPELRYRTGPVGTSTSHGHAHAHAHGHGHGHGPIPMSSPGSAPYYGPFGAGRDSPETQRRKKEEFLTICSRAWDLFHS